MFRIKARAAGDQAASRASSEIVKRPSTISEDTGLTRRPARPNRGLIRVIDGIGQENFVAILQQRHERRIDAEGCARGCEHFRRRVEAKTVVALQFLSHRFPKNLLAAVIGIGRASVPERSRASFYDVRGRGKIRLTPHQGDQILILRLALEYFGKYRIDGRGPQF